MKLKCINKEWNVNKKIFPLQFVVKYLLNTPPGVRKINKNVQSNYCAVHSSCKEEIL